MKKHYLGLCVAALAAANLAAQTTFTKADGDEIQGLSAKYATTLGTCQAEAYAGLFTPDGIFYYRINARTAVGREQLAEAAGGGRLG